MAETLEHKSIYGEIDTLISGLREEYDKEMLKWGEISRKFLIKAYKIIRQVWKKVNELLELNKQSKFSDISIEAIWLKNSLERFKDDLNSFSARDKSVKWEISFVTSCINQILVKWKKSNSLEVFSKNPKKILEVINASDYEDIKQTLFHWKSREYDDKWWVWKIQQLWKTASFRHFFEMPMEDIKKVRVKWHSFLDIIVMSGLDQKLVSKYSWATRINAIIFDINKEEHFKAWLALFFGKKQLIQSILNWSRKTNEEEMLESDILKTWKLTLPMIKFKFFNYRMNNNFKFTSKNDSYEYLLQFKRKDIEKIRIWNKKMSDIMKVTWRPNIENFDPYRRLHFRMWLSAFFWKFNDYNLFLERHKKLKNKKS